MRGGPPGAIAANMHDFHHDHFHGGHHHHHHRFRHGHAVIGGFFGFSDYYYPYPYYPYLPPDYFYYETREYCDPNSPLFNPDICAGNTAPY
jgi:hypothetical protein